MKKGKVLISLLVWMLSLVINCQTNDRTAKEFFVDGNIKVSDQDYRGAVYSFSEAIEQDSSFIQAYENRGVAKYHLQDYKGALSDFNKALELNPYDYSTYGRRGWTRYRLQDLRGAIEDFNLALQGGEDIIQYYIIRGQANYFLHNYPSALEDFNRVVRFLNGSREERGAAYFWKGLIEINEGQKEYGCTDLRKAGKLGFAKANEVIELYCQ